METERDHARRRISTVADALAAVRDQLVFIGGTVLPLLVDVDRRFHAPRMTDDVDAVGVATDYRASHAVEEAVRGAGYTPDFNARHKGRYIGPTGDVFDLSFAGSFAGASGGRVDELAIEAAQRMDVRPEVRHLSATGLLLMKCAAFQDRGLSKPGDSKDLADLAVLLVGTPIVEDVRSRREHIQAEVRTQVVRLLETSGLAGALVTHFAERRPIPPDTAEELADEALAILASLRA